MNPSDTSMTVSQSPLVSIDDVKTLLRKAGSTDDDLLYGYLDAATARLRQLCMPLSAMTVTDSFDGDGTASPLALSTFPVSTVTSVTIYGYDGSPQVLPEAGGATGVGSGYWINKRAGTLRRVGTPYWPHGSGNISVTYTAGPDRTPPEVAVGLKLYVQLMWESRSTAGNLAGPSGNPPAEALNPLVDIPNEVMGIIVDWLKPPRVA